MIPILYRRAHMTATAKLGAIVDLATRGAEDEPNIRELAVRLARSAPVGDHVARLRLLHAWVRDGVDYHREPVEMLHPASVVAREGGDCDDKVILLGALAWSLKYPFRVVPIGNPLGPRHYSIQLGAPESEQPEGDDRTVWHWAEPSSVLVPFGESPTDAERRLGGAVG